MLFINFDYFDECSSDVNKMLGLLLSSLNATHFTLKKNKSYFFEYDDAQIEIILSHTIILTALGDELSCYLIIGDEFYRRRKTLGKTHLAKLKKHPFYLSLEADGSVQKRSLVLTTKSQQISSPDPLYATNPRLQECIFEQLSQMIVDELSREVRMTKLVYPSLSPEISGKSLNPDKTEFRCCFFLPYFPGMNLFEFIRNLVF